MIEFEKHELDDCAPSHNTLLRTNCDVGDYVLTLRWRIETLQAERTGLLESLGSQDECEATIANLQTALAERDSRIEQLTAVDRFVAPTEPLVEIQIAGGFFQVPRKVVERIDELRKAVSKADLESRMSLVCARCSDPTQAIAKLAVAEAVIAELKAANASKA